MLNAKPHSANVQNKKCKCGKKFNLCVKNGPAMRKYILAAKTYTAN